MAPPVLGPVDAGEPRSHTHARAIVDRAGRPRGARRPLAVALRQRPPAHDAGDRARVARHGAGGARAAARRPALPPMAGRAGSRLRTSTAGRRRPLSSRSACGCWARCSSCRCPVRCTRSWRRAPRPSGTRPRPPPPRSSAPARTPCRSTPPRPRAGWPSSPRWSRWPCSPPRPCASAGRSCGPRWSSSRWPSSSRCTPSSRASGSATALFGVFESLIPPFGPFVSKNHFAGYVEMAALLAVGLATGLASENRVGPGALGWIESPRASRVVLAWAAAAVLVLAVPVSLSRGGVDQRDRRARRLRPAALVDAAHRSNGATAGDRCRGLAATRSRRLERRPRAASLLPRSRRSPRSPSPSPSSSSCCPSPPAPASPRSAPAAATRPRPTASASGATRCGSSPRARSSAPASARSPMPSRASRPPPATSASSTPRATSSSCSPRAASLGGVLAAAALALPLRGGVARPPRRPAPPLARRPHRRPRRPRRAPRPQPLRLQPPHPVERAARDAARGDRPGAGSTGGRALSTRDALAVGVGRDLTARPRPARGSLAGRPPSAASLLASLASPWLRSSWPRTPGPSVDSRGFRLRGRHAPPHRRPSATWRAHLRHRPGRRRRRGWCSRGSVRRLPRPTRTRPSPACGEPRPDGRAALATGAPCPADCAVLSDGRRAQQSRPALIPIAWPSFRTAREATRSMEAADARRAIRHAVLHRVRIDAHRLAGRRSAGLASGSRGRSPRRGTEGRSGSG